MITTLAQTSSGFLPTRASFMLDFVVVAMVALVVVLGASIYLVRSRRRFRLHKQIQLVTAVILLVTVVAFEVDVRLFTAWRTLAAESAWYQSGVVDVALWVHLVFAIPTPLVWIYTIVMALNKIPADPRPCEYSARHRFWGWTSAVLLVMTAVTGWVFYILAFAL